MCRSVKTYTIDGQYLVTTLQPAISCRRPAGKHALDDDGKVPALATEPSHDSEAEAMLTAT